MAFVHLHVHSHYSLGKALASPAELARAAAQLGMPALALTDQDSLAGMAEHLRACREAGIKPLAGAELTVMFPGAHGESPLPHHLTVLIESEAGYRSLVRLLNAGRRYATAKAPFAVPLADLISGVKGLIVLTGCPAGRLFRAAVDRQLDEAVSHIQTLLRAAGRDHVFLEITPPVHKADETINRRLLELSAYAGVPAVATQNVRYVKKGDHLGVFAKTAADLTDEAWAAWIHSRPRRHFCDETEMRSIFGWRPELLANTERIAAMCRFASPSAAQHFPLQALPRGEDPEAVLWRKAVAQLPRIASGEAEIRLKERLNREISLIRQAKLAPYFLLLHELAGELDRAGIVRGPAQGMWQGSAAACALGLASLDPAAFRLAEPNWLERSEHFPVYRFEIADSDQERAAEIIAGRIGKFMAARVGRWATTRRPALLKELAERVGVSGARLKRLLAERPARARKGRSSNGNGNGNGNGHEEGLKVDDSAFLRKAANLLAERPQALRPDGVMLALSGQDIEDTVPLAELPEAGLTTTLDEASLDALGIARVDLVTSTLMTVIAWAVRIIREQGDASFHLGAIPLDDPRTFALLAQGRTNCIGELHSISAKTLLRSSPPNSVLELAALLRRRRRGEAGAPPDATADLTPVMPAALAAYWAAWLKAHHPLPLMAAMLTRSLASPQRFAILLREAKRDKIAIEPPDLTLSRFPFMPENGGLRTGLAVVRQLGERAYEELDNERKARPFDDLVDFCRRTDPKIFTNRLVANLIKAGALDRFDLPRSHHLAMVDDIFRDLKAERTHTDDIRQPTLFDLEELELKRPGSDVRLDEVPEFDLEQLLLYERDAAGYFISEDPFTIYEPLIRQIRARSPFDLRRRDLDRDLYVAGYIDHVEWDSPMAGESAVAMLDCEGTVVRVARGARSFIGPELECAGPALLAGVVRRNGEEIYLEAREIFSLEFVYDLSRRVARMDLDAAGKDRRSMKEIAAVLKAYPGDTDVWLDGDEPEFQAFFCPPLYLALAKIISADGIALEDAEGNAVEVPPPTVIA